MLYNQPYVINTCALQAGTGLGALSSLESKLALAAAAAENAAAGAIGANMIPAVHSQMGVA